MVSARDVDVVSGHPVGATGASLRIAYLDGVAGVQQLDFQIDYTDEQMTTPLTDTIGFRTNTDEIADSTATDTVEPAAPPTTTTAMRATSRPG